MEEVTRYTRRGPAASVRSVYEAQGIDPGVSMSKSTFALLILEVGLVMLEAVLNDTTLAKVWVNRVSIPPAVSFDAAEAVRGPFVNCAGTVKERRSPGWEMGDALSGVGGAVEGNIMTISWMHVAWEMAGVRGSFKGSEVVV